MKSLIFALTMTFSLMGFAETTPQTDCPERYERVVDTRVHQLESSRKDTCFVSIGNVKDYTDLVYRNFLVSADGSLMIFVSGGEGPEDKVNGAKEFYFFTRDVKSQFFDISADQTQLRVNSRFDFDFIFDTTTSQLVSMNNATVTVEDKVSLENDAGVTMVPLKGLIYELPFMIGGAPSGNLKVSGVFKDAFGHECKVKNSAVFKSVGDGDTDVKYTDAQLKTYLKKACPQIQY